MYDDAPPCEVEIYDRFGQLETCDKPTLHRENAIVRDLFLLLSSRDRPISGFGSVGRIPTTAIIDACREYDQTHDTFEKIIMIDELVYPKIVDWVRKQSEAKQKSAQKPRSRKGR